MSTNTDSREVSRAFGRRQCRTCDGSGFVSERPITDWQHVSNGNTTFSTRLVERFRCPECAKRDAEARRLDLCQRRFARASLIAALVPLTLVGLALAWVMWRMLSGRWGM